jgi:phage repressor protein C with HTH and peptisase S24 domain/DNA-binding XRE family transcriptional regulator
MSLGQIIRDRREEKNLTQDQVSVRVNISKPYLSNIETGRVGNPPSDKVLVELEKALEFATGELVRIGHEMVTPPDVRERLEALQMQVEQLQAQAGKGKGKVDAKKGKGKGTNVSDWFSAGRPVPIINKVSAGYPYNFTDMDYPAGVADDYIRCPDVHDPHAFAARVVGDSMIPKYVEGDVVIFAPATQPRTGDDCFVRFTEDNSTTFKRYVADKAGRIRLEAINDTKYTAKIYEPDQISGLWPAIMRIEKVRK